MNNKRGAIAGGIITFVVGMILILVVAFPLIQSTVASLNVTGTDKTIASVIPTLLLVAALVYVTSLMSKEE